MCIFFMSINRFRHYIIGIEEIDKEHLEFLELFESLDTEFIATKEIEEIRERLFLHFKNEEDYMERINYPYKNAHKIEHSYIKDKIDSIISKSKKSEDFTIRFTISSLKESLYKHIDDYDTQIGNFVNKRTK